MYNNPSREIKLYEDGTIIICPKHKKGKLPVADKLLKAELKKRGNIKKSYSLDSHAKRLIRCSAIRLFLTRKNSVKWFALTFSKAVNQIEANNCLSKFLENLTKNYYANNYIVVKENHKSGIPHYHCIVDIPFTNFKIINHSWCVACRHVMPFSPNALTSGNKKIIDDIKGISKYICKYITKANSEISDTKLYFISHNCISKPKVISETHLLYLSSHYGLKKIKVDNVPTYAIIKDYCTFLFLKNFNFLPENFEIIRKKPQKIPKKPTFQDNSIQANLSF